MKGFLKAMQLKSFVKAMRARAIYWLTHNVMLLVTLVDMLVPLIALLIYMHIEGPLDLLASLVVCFLIQLGVSVSRHFYMWQNERQNVPIPSKRFTRDEGNGEVTIEYARLQELILFTYEYENWIEEQGMKPEEKTNGNNSN